MNTLLVIATFTVPLVAVLLTLSERGRWWPTLAAVPAIAAALLVPSNTFVDAEWLLMGARFGFTSGDRVFLAAAGVLYLAASAYSGFYMRDDRHAGRFRVLLLLAMSGNFALIAGQDMMSFYLGFTVMGFAAYGLIVHDGNDRVRHAGRVYLAMTLLGEFALFAAFLLLYQRTGTLIPEPASIAGGSVLEFSLITLAFGIKAGLVGLHMWLPLAHPAAPVPASAVLSGAMIKTALIGWMRYLPLGAVALPELGTALLALGLITALFALPLGLLQREPKVILAYSSISKMGIAVAALGFAALVPAAAPAAVAAMTFYAAHHALAKGALFLGVGVVSRFHARWLWLLTLPALALVGAPFTSGAVAKEQLKSAITGALPFWVDTFAAVSLLAALVTTLLMARFLFLLRGNAGSTRPICGGMLVPWLGLVVLGVSSAWVHGVPTPSLEQLWPAVVGVAVVFLFIVRPSNLLNGWVGRLPAGDALVPLLAAWACVRQLFARWVWIPQSMRRSPPLDGLSPLRTLTLSLEQTFVRPAVSGAVWLALIVITLGVFLTS